MRAARRRPAPGLDAAEVERRRAQYGPNKLAEAEKEPGWRAFLRQYRDLMQLVLLGAAIVSIVALQEFATGLVIIGLTVLNAILGLNQEGKAAESVAALQKMLVIKAHVRRDGELVDMPAEELVPGDVVTFEAGDKVPADGRLLVAATLEIEEAALTGESTPVLKAVDPVAGDDVPLGDRVDMAYMNSTVTRGRGEMVVTATGMATEVGQISGMLSGVEQEKTPLTRQLDQLTVLITIMAGVALALVGRPRADPRRRLRRALPDRDQPGDRRDPDRPARGRHDDALAGDAGAGRQGRDRQAAAVGGDARLDLGDLLGQDRHADAEPDDRAPARRRRPALHDRGRGLLDRGQRSCASRARRTRRSSRSCCRWRSPTTPRFTTARSSATRPRPRSSCSRRRAGSTSTRRGALYPRVAEVPFDSEYKLMATFHELEDGGRKVVRCFVKGAPDVLLARSSHVRGADGSAVPADDGARARAGRERPARRRGAARAGRGLARLRPGRVRRRRRRCSTRSRA